MLKSVCCVMVSAACLFTAAGQLNTDSVQSKAKQARFLMDTAFMKPVFLQPVLPANFYTAHLPFFCDKEIKLQKVVKLPIKFRLGSQADCDRLEGKH